ncbi:hypothetical protein O9A_00120 [Bartonella koehlerae C-29]|uniref:Uncharacterized protein n=1 Tax=Bartonella koehlerae C-29 TaxID=1134510 RepID=A0A067WC16_9HYPH|nr:hypothetical protein [Bartonella koehlerae]KEC56466.1 hypothetical protein O9A_00120 [Bartonella koehlerae C-29]
MAVSLYHSRVLHKCHREKSLGALRDNSLKQARELVTQWHSVLREGRDPLKNAINKSVRDNA